jgi:hypothetical protein
MNFSGEKLSELKDALELLNQITIKSKKSEIKSTAEKIHNIVYDRSIIWNELISSDLFNVIDSTGSFKYIKYGHKSAMLSRIEYARENLESIIEKIEKEEL